MNNNVVYHAKLHWIIFMSPCILLFIAMAAGITVPQFGTVSFFIGIVALIWIGLTWGIYHFSSLIIKTRQVVFRTGMLVRKTVDIPLNKIESIDISQSIVGSLMGFGSLVVTGTGGTRHVINYISNPLTCRRYIEQLMHQ